MSIIKRGDWFTLKCCQVTDLAWSLERGRLVLTGSEGLEEEDPVTDRWVADAERLQCGGSPAHESTARAARSGYREVESRKCYVPDCMFAMPRSALAMASTRGLTSAKRSTSARVCQAPASLLTWHGSVKRYGVAAASNRPRTRPCRRRGSLRSRVAQVPPAELADYAQLPVRRHRPRRRYQSAAGRARSRLGLYRRYSSFGGIT